MYLIQILIIKVFFIIFVRVREELEAVAIHAVGHNERAYRAAIISSWRTRGIVK